MEAAPMRAIARPRARVLAWLAAVAAVTCAITACGNEFVPAGYSPTHPYGTAKPWLPGPTPTPEPSGPMTVGVDLYDTQDYSLEQTKALGNRAISYIANTLKVKAIGIAWDYTVPTLTSDQVNTASAVTPSVADIQALTQIARAHGLRVEYRVLLEVAGQNGQSESLRPASTQTWLTSLLTAETPALRLAQQEQVSEVVVGTETAAIEGSPLWKGFFTQAAKIYGGMLSYATWGGGGTEGFFSSKRVLPPVGLYGATAYPSVNLPADASVSQLTAAWNKFLQTAPESVLRRTAIDEIGIPAAVGSYSDPWNWDDVTAAPDDEVQANWFEAACDAAVAAHLRAIYFWNVNLSDNPENDDLFASAVRFEDRTASETAIRSCEQTAADAGQQ
jgi:hypothetical protein